MKAFLMYRDRDFDLGQEPPSNQQALIQDLELSTLFDAMAQGDRFLYEVATASVLGSLEDPQAILYRQGILKDCLKNPTIVRAVYGIAVEAIEGKKKQWFVVYGINPNSTLRASVEMLQMFVGMLRRLRSIADEHAFGFESEGFTRLFRMLETELADEYFASVEDHLRELRFRDGVLVSGELGRGNEGINYALLKPHDKLSWMKRVLARKPSAYTLRIDPRDESAARTLEELKDRVINLVANALAQSSDHILSFFTMLRTELAFYVGCLNLHEQLSGMGEPACFPLPAGPEERRHAFDGLYDACLALTMKQGVVGNDVNADSKDLVVITGANQGGKTTFLRSIGLAQLMMQCGMFVPAESFSANVSDGLFTHYRREEDAAMKSGKLDEELGRVSGIAEKIKPDSMVLFNESFAATNEKEGSEIARQIVSALLEKRIKVFFVTHLYEFAHGFHSQQGGSALFLRAERRADGSRTFKLIEGEPLETSYGEDLYRGIFEAAPDNLTSIER